MTKNKGLYPALIERLGEMVKENVELEQRVHQLTDDYNRVVRQLNAKDDADGNDSKNVLEQMRQMRDHFDSLERKKEVAEVNYKDLWILTEKKEKQLERFEQADFMEWGKPCSTPGHGTQVGTPICQSCRHFLSMDLKNLTSVLCAYRYDSKTAEESKEQKTASNQTKIYRAMTKKGGEL